MNVMASDLANPEFVGASNPDSRLHVTFYIKPVQNAFETQKQGKPVFQDTNYVRIEVPGDRNLTLDVPVREEHKERFPIQYARFTNANNSEQLVGVSIDQWPLLTRSQAEELKAMKFRTVEQISAASDAQLQTIGMVGGMSPLALRDRAKAYLMAAKDSSYAEGLAQQARDQDERMKQMQATHAQEMAALREQLDALVKAMNKKPAKAATADL